MPYKCPNIYMISFLFQVPPSNIVLPFPPCLPSNAPPNFLKDPNVGPKPNQQKRRELGHTF